MKDKKENYVQVGEPQKDISGITTYTGEPDWLKQFDEEFAGNTSDVYDWLAIERQIKEFIGRVLSEYRQELKKKVEGMKRNTSVIKQAEVALKFREKYSLVQIRSIVKGYNQACDDFIKLLEE